MFRAGYVEEMWPKLGVPTFRLIDLVRDRQVLDAAQREAANYLESTAPTPAATSALLKAWSARFRLIDVG